MKTIRSSLGCLLLVGALLFSTIQPTSAASVSGLENFVCSRTYETGHFADVADSAWYASSVKYAYELGLVNGNSETTFNPDGNITIAETIALAARMHSIYVTGDADFVQGTPWWRVYYDYAIKHAIIDKSQNWDVTKKATRAEFVEILANALPKEALDPINDINKIPDVPTEENYAYAVYRLYRAGVLTGNDSKGTFAPETNIQRSAVAALVSRMVNISLRKTFVLDGQLIIGQRSLYVDGEATITVTVTGGEQIFAQYDKTAVEIRWGEWAGDNVPLTITPLKDGATTILIYLESDPQEFECILVRTGAPLSSSQDERQNIYSFLIEQVLAYGTYENGTYSLIFFESEPDSYVRNCNVNYDVNEDSLYLVSIAVNATNSAKYSYTRMKIPELIGSKYTVDYVYSSGKTKLTGKATFDPKDYTKESQIMLYQTGGFPSSVWQFLKQDCNYQLNTALDYLGVYILTPENYTLADLGFEKY